MWGYVFNGCIENNIFLVVEHLQFYGNVIFRSVFSSMFGFEVEPFGLLSL